MQLSGRYASASGRNVESCDLFLEQAFSDLTENGMCFVRPSGGGSECTFSYCNPEENFGMWLDPFTGISWKRLRSGSVSGSFALGYSYRQPVFYRWNAGEGR